MVDHHPGNYELAFATAVRANHAIAFGFARHALIAILDAAGLRAGDEVILSALTCKVVPLALLSLKLKPVYVDVSTETMNLDAEAIETAIGPATRAILFQHTYGNLAGILPAAKISASRDLLLVEDCAQCLPYATDGYMPGSVGRAAIFSTNLLKPLPAGSGGMAVTADNELARKIRTHRDRLRTPGASADLAMRIERSAHKYLLSPAWYWSLLDAFREISSSYDVRPLIDEIQAEITDQARCPSAAQMVVGTTWLQDIVAHATHRRECCREYAHALDGAPGVRPIAIDVTQPLYYFPILADDKPALLLRARRRRLEMVAWPVRAPIFPVERIEDLRAYGYAPGSCPIAEDMATRLIGLPLRRRVSPGHRHRVIELLCAGKP